MATAEEAAAYNRVKLKEILTFLCGVRDKTAIEIFMSKHREDHQCVHDLIKECLTVHSYSLLSDILECGHFTPDHHTISWAYSHEHDDKTLVEVFGRLLKGAADDRHPGSHTERYNCHLTSLLGRALLSASREGRNEVVKYLLEVGCDPHILQAPVYMTPLDLASSFGHLTAQDILLQSGASVSKENLLVVSLGINGTEDNSVIQIGHATDSTPLHYAVAAGHKDCMLQLLRAGADVNALDQFGCTPLTLAVSYQHPEVVEALVIEKNCDIDMKDDHSGMTALHRAADLGNMGIISTLLGANANPNIKDWDGDPPLSLAVNSGHSDVCSSLLPLMGEVDRDGKLLEMSMMRGYWQIVRTLIQYGASSTLIWKKEITDSMWPVSSLEKGQPLTLAYSDCYWSTVALREPSEVQKLLKMLTAIKLLKHMANLKIRSCLNFVCKTKVEQLTLPFTLQQSVLQVNNLELYYNS